MRNYFFTLTAIILIHSSVKCAMENTELIQRPRTESEAQEIPVYSRVKTLFVACSNPSVSTQPDSLQFPMSFALSPYNNDTCNIGLEESQKRLLISYPSTPKSQISDKEWEKIKEDFIEFSNKKRYE